ncbi:MAG: FtsX-like permease family protein, partial [Ginsengibacter sp.]
REIGIRKVLGGLKKQLIIQFLIESIILVFFAMVFALIIYILSKEMFSNILGKEIPPLGDFPLYFVAFPLMLIFIIGFIAGIYPAFVLSSLKSVESLKGKLSSVKENVWLRKSLVAFQFGTATIAFIGAIIISSQINLFFSKDIGFNKDYILSAQLPRDWTPQGVTKAEDMRKQFTAMPQVVNATLSFTVPDGNSSGSASLYKADADSNTVVASEQIVTDEYYASTFGISMAAGKFFSAPGAFTDPFTIVINQAQAKAFGWNNTADAIGKQLKFQSGGGQVFTIVGVTKDFHFGSMQKPIQPITFLHVTLANIYRNFSFKIRPGGIGNSIGALQKKWSVLMPGVPFEYTFMDDALAKIYKSEIQLKKASYTATVLALIIVLLGVLGLISLSVQKRTKEIGIRKVLGSSVSGIMGLFMKEFLLVILISAIVACPVAYVIMHNWLQAYAYRIGITAQPFLIAILVLAFITALLICIQTIKAALSNPIKSLRTE